MASYLHRHPLRILLLFLVGLGRLSAWAGDASVGPQFIKNGRTLTGIIEGSADVVKKLEEDFTGKTDFARDGGFAAMGGDRVVRVESSEGVVSWNSMVRNDGYLIFGARDSLGSILWDTALDLGDVGMRTIYLIAGVDATERATLVMKHGLISKKDLTFGGDGRIDLTTDNQQFTGRLVAEGSELWLRGEGSLKNSHSVEAGSGAHFVIDNSELGHALDNRFGGELALSGATFRYLTRFNGDSHEAIGDLRINGAARFDISASAAGSGKSFLTINELLFGPGGTLNFTTSGHADYASNASVRFKKRPDLWNGIIMHATINGSNWATVDHNNRLRDYDGYLTGAETTWHEDANAAPSADQRLTADRSLSSLKLSGVGTGFSAGGKANGRVVDLDGHKLGVSGAGILSTGEHRNHIKNGTLHTTLDTLEFHVYGTGGLEVSSVIANKLNGGWMDATGLLKAGDGELILSGSTNNTFKGAVDIAGGTLTLAKTSGKAGAAIANFSSIYIGGGHSTATLNIRGARNQISENRNVFMKGGLKGLAVLRLEKTAEGQGPFQKLAKLEISGTGIIEFGREGVRDTEGSGAKGEGGTAASESVLILKELNLDQGELLVRGWDAESTRILLDDYYAPSEELLAKIRFEGQGRTRAEKVRFGNSDYWEIKAEFVSPPGGVGGAPAAPEPSTYGLAFSASGLGLALWRRWQLRRRRRFRVRVAPPSRCGTTRAAARAC